MYSRNDCYVRTANLRIRPVPEQNCCFVFTPDRPNLYTLNPSAWLVLELCDGQSGEALEAAYRASMDAGVDAGETAAELEQILEDFVRKGIVERRPATVPATAVPTSTAV